VALNRGFYETLPDLPEVTPDKADIVWLVYDLILDEPMGQYCLTLTRQVYTEFKSALRVITESEAGDETVFIRALKAKLRKARNGEEPSTTDIANLEETIGSDNA
jgi:hypothetical protein